MAEMSCFSFILCMVLNVFNILARRDSMIDESDIQIKSSLKHANGELFAYASGRHNSLLVDILEVLVPYRVPDSVLLYMHDRINNLLIYENKALERLGVPSALGNHLADIVLYQPDRNRLYLIYAINRFGPVYQQRKHETELLLKCCSAERVYVSVVYNRSDYGHYAPYIAWGSQVWMAQVPDHVVCLV